MTRHTIRSEKNRKQGFTLIELLVVIAIISILAAILFPVFAKARENARRTACLSNMKQIGLGIMQYLQDYDERYPRAWGGLDGPGTDPDQGRYPDPTDIETDKSKPGGAFKVNPNPGGGANNYRTWMDYIFPYVKSVQLFRCPSYSPTADQSSYGYSTALNGYHRSTEYYTNNSLAPRNIPITTAAVRRVSEIVMIAEYTFGYNYSMSPGNMYTYATAAPGTTNYNLVTPHLNGGTAVYADGHAKWRTRGMLLTYIKSSSMSACDPTTNPPSPATRATCARDWNPYID
jgi:prepilin-type N-terminal cleavage/methylation domain-containing protein/prepilin-type processing-associated H-X9-DG protein